MDSYFFKYMSRGTKWVSQFAGEHQSLVKRVVGEGNFVSAVISAGYYAPLDEEGKERTSIPSKSALPHKQVDVDQTLQVFTPLQLGNVTLRNRIIRAAAFDGANEEDVVATHINVAKGGVGMSVVAYCCVSKDGRTFEEQIDMTNREKSLRVLVPLVQGCHQHGAKVAAQLTHGGSFSSEHLSHTTNVAPSSVFAPASLSFPKASDRKDMDRLVRDFCLAAQFAVNEIGFDAIELHCGHGYLLSQWMSPLLNCRTDQYGGSAVNRARFPLEVLVAVRQALPVGTPILVKMNCQDGVHGGLEIRDAMEIAECLAEHCDLIVVSCGLVAHNGFFMLRGTTPIPNLVLALPGFKKYAAFLFGNLAVPSVPYDDCFLRDGARLILNRVREKTKVCLLGGVSTLSEMEGALEEGFACVQMARPLIREPDFIHRIQAEVLEHKQLALADRGEDEFDVETKCIRCNQCVLASVDPLKDVGCPFRKLEVQAAKNKQQLSISPTTARGLLRDLEDLEPSKL